MNLIINIMNLTLQKRQYQNLKNKIYTVMISINVIHILLLNYNILEAFKTLIHTQTANFLENSQTKK